MLDNYFNWVNFVLNRFFLIPFAEKPVFFVSSMRLLLFPELAILKLDDYRLVDV